MKNLHSIKWLAFCGLAILSMSCSDKYSSDVVSIQNLTYEMRENPIGVAFENPRLSWQSVSEQRGIQQEAYRILVASSKEKLEANEADVWDSGKIKSEESHLVSIGNVQDLKAHTYYYWKVQVWTNKTEGFSESEAAYFLTALQTEKDWGSSQWIGLDKAMPWDDESTHARLSARYLRNEFDCRKEVKQAQLFIAGLGLYELWLNGEKVGDQVMAPVPTDYRKSIMYNAYDVTSYVQQGKNAIGVILGNGRYYAMRQQYKPYKWANFGYPKMRLIMYVEYVDGRTQTVISNASWRLNPDGPIIANNEFDGEEYDARKEFGDWSKPNYEMNRSWRPAERVTIPQAVLVPQPCNNMKIMAVFHPQSVTKLDAKTYILDMGQNMTGWVRMKVKGEKGREVKLRFAETLLEDGHLSMANLRDALVTDKYILKGSAEGEEWAPRFVTHGFRYVEVTNYPGVPVADDFVGEFVCDEMADMGTLESSSEVLNAVWRNAYWGVRGNYKGMPVDCPQRNERMPWLGDRTNGAYGESFIFDNANLYAKWMDDISQAQRWDGAIPDVAPAYWNYYSDDVTWPATMFMICDMLYRQYGDIRPIEKHFSAMKKYMDYMRQYYLNDKGLMRADKYGDWCMPPEAPEIIHSADPSRVTDGTLIATAYFYQLYQLMIKFADLLGCPDEVADYVGYAEAMKEVFNTTFYDTEKKCYDNNTVTANLLALAFDLAEKENVSGICENIQHTLMEVYGGTMATGTIGNQWLFRTLTEKGYGDIAFTLASTEKYPSFGYMVSKGATTIWELWNGDTANPKMNSGNHVMQLGDFLIWSYEHLAGIKSHEQKVAFKRIIMKPAFDIDDLSYIKSSYQTPYGLVKSSWQKQEASLDWQISIPANTTAIVCMPQINKNAVKENGNKISSVKEVKYLTSDGENSYWEVQSGNYQFNISL